MRQIPPISKIVALLFPCFGMVNLFLSSFFYSWSFFFTPAKFRQRQSLSWPKLQHILNSRMILTILQLQQRLICTWPFSLDDGYIWFLQMTQLRMISSFRPLSFEWCCRRFSSSFFSLLREKIDIFWGFCLMPDQRLQCHEILSRHNLSLGFNEQKDFSNYCFLR